MNSEMPSPVDPRGRLRVILRLRTAGSAVGLLPGFEAAERPAHAAGGPGPLLTGTVDGLAGYARLKRHPSVESIQIDTWSRSWPLGPHSGAPADRHRVRAVPSTSALPTDGFSQPYRYDRSEASLACHSVLDAHYAGFDLAEEVERAIGTSMKWPARARSAAEPFENVMSTASRAPAEGADAA